MSSAFDEYLEAYDEAAQVANDKNNLDFEHKFRLYQFIYGDTFFRLPAKQEMEIYRNAGADVYMAYFDMNTKFDLLTETTSCCGVGHGNDLLYLFGYLA